MNILLRSLSAFLFLLVTIVLSLLSVPAALLDRSGKSYLWLARLWSKSFLFLFGITVMVSGKQHITSGEHYVYVANHSSYTDIPILLASIPDDIRLVLRKSLTKIPIWGWALLVSPFLIIDRSSPAQSQKTIAKAVSTIRRGASILLFPEGTRTSTSHLQPFKRGAFRLAANSETPVLPVAIIGSFAILPRTRKLPTFGGNVILNIGEPIHTHDIPAITPREKEMTLMDRAEEEVRRLLKNAG